MHFPEFKEETFSQQAQLLCRDGVYVSERTAGDFFVALYALYGYYTAVYYRPQSGELVTITSFQNAALLDPYLSKISLRGILQPCFISEFSPVPTDQDSRL